LWQHWRRVRASSSSLLLLLSPFFLAASLSAFQHRPDVKKKFSFKGIHRTLACTATPCAVLQILILAPVPLTATQCCVSGATDLCLRREIVLPLGPALEMIPSIMSCTAVHDGP
jgi:hypothetical protein